MKPTTLAAVALFSAMATGSTAAIAQGATAPPTPAPGASAPARTRQPVPGAVPVTPPAPVLAAPVSLPTGSGTVLTKHLVPSRPTVFIFAKLSSSLERRFLQQVCADAGRKAGVGVLNLTTGSEPVARKYEIDGTPTALIFDRRGRLVARSADPEQIRASIQRAVGIMRIDWPEAGDPRVEAADKAAGRALTGSISILRTMAFQPEWLAHINDLSRKAHFAPGYLDVRIKEMIAAYVSALNDCRY
jgi:hypothetical protein